MNDKNFLNNIKGLFSYTDELTGNLLIIYLSRNIMYIKVI